MQVNFPVIDLSKWLIIYESFGIIFAFLIKIIFSAKWVIWVYSSPQISSYVWHLFERLSQTNNKSLVVFDIVTNLDDEFEKSKHRNQNYLRMTHNISSFLNTVFIVKPYASRQSETGILLIYASEHMHLNLYLWNLWDDDSL